MLTARPAARRPPRHPSLIVVQGFAVMILIGGIFLSLPVSSVEGRWTPFLDALFTATSAVCVTGLVVVDTGTYWSFFGQAAILVLMQAGGLGFMISSIFLLLIAGRRTTLQQRLLLRDSLGGGNVGGILALARRIIAYTLICEIVAAAILAARFWSGRDPEQAIWWGIFHAVSAFTNGSFDLTGGFQSLIPFRHDPLVLLTIAALIIAGGISYTVVEDVARRRDFRRLTLDSKLVLVTTGALLLGGTIGLLLEEWANAATLGPLSPAERVLNAFFLAVVPRTAGFSTVDVGRLSEPSLQIISALMFVGGASGSTAGGIKVQTFALLVCAAIAAGRGLTQIEAFGRRVPINDVLRAVAVLLLSMVFVFALSLALKAVEPHGLIRLVFEAVSAFGTVGLSTGVTPETAPAGRILLMIGMFVGRLGPLALVLALIERERPRLTERPEESIKIG